MTNILNTIRKWSNGFASKRPPELEGDIQLVSGSFRDNTIDMRLRHPAFAVIAEGIGEFYLETSKGNPGNYVTMDMYYPKGNVLLEVTVRNKARPTPAAIADVYRRTLAGLLDDVPLETAERIRGVLARFNHLPDSTDDERGNDGQP